MDVPTIRALNAMQSNEMRHASGAFHAATNCAWAWRMPNCLRRSLSMNKPQAKNPPRAADAVADKQRSIQREQDQRDRNDAKPAGRSEGAMQTGSHPYPTDLPAQHLP